MKKPWSRISILLFLVLAWRFLLAIVENFLAVRISLNPYYLGKSPWVNFDGGHYLSIAESGYHQYQQAFFPLHPLLIRLITRIFGIPYVTSSLITSHIALVGGIIFFYKLAVAEKIRFPLWSVILFLLFPTSFFFAAGYTESLFFVLSVLTIYFIRKGNYFYSGIFGMLASATRLFGIFLIFFCVVEFLTKKKKERNSLIFSMIAIPLGLIFYMVYLYRSVGDPLAFFHEQPLFGAGRTGESLVLLPQVFWRYFKIFFTASFSFQYAIALVEFGVFFFAAYLLWITWKKNILPIQYFLYCVAIILVPTFTGTLSSLPRYVLSAFPLFFILGNVHNKWLKIGVSVIFTIGLILSTSFFLSGYFVA